MYVLCEDGEILLSAFPTAQRVNLPTCSLDCPFNPERETGDSEFKRTAKW